MTRTMNGLNVIFQTLSLLLMCWIINKLSFVDSEVVFEGNNLMRHYVGCFSNLENGLNSFLKSSKNIKECLTHCSESDSYTFAALKNGSECYCVNQFSQSAPDAECEVSCKSSRRVPCGGRSAYSIYTVCVVGNYGKDCNISCTSCHNSIPCKRNTGECIDECYKNSDDDDKCDLSNRLIDVNVAFNQDAEQSSTYSNEYNKNFPAALAVDGNFNNNFFQGKICSHTECSYNNSWLSVDLIGRRHVKEIVVTNRQDFGGRIRYFQVYLSENKPSGVSLQDLKNYHLCNSYPYETEDIKTLNMTCNDDAIGRYLIVVLPRVECLSICELEVYLHDCYNCKENETCSEEVFDSRRRRCVCKTGFSKETITSNCLDVDECQQSDRCSKNAMCINTIGSYLCKCNVGYFGNATIKNGCRENPVHKNYLGCYTKFETLNLTIFEGHATIQTCLKYCSYDFNQNTFAALKNRSECHCGERFSWSAEEDECNVCCAGNLSQHCGGFNTYSVYTSCPIGYHGLECNIPCWKCHNSVPCFRENGSCYENCDKSLDSESCDLSRLLTDVNLAFNQEAHQISTYNNSNFPSGYGADLSVDGNFNSNFEQGLTCSHTNNNLPDPQWLYVMLKSNLKIRNIRITNRDELGNRINSLKIYVSDNRKTIEKNHPNESLKCNSDSISGSDVINIEVVCRDELGAGRIVLFIVEKEYPLTICELEIFAHDCKTDGRCQQTEVCGAFSINGQTHHHCVCKKGYKRKSLITHCEDINECDDSNVCSENSNCTNTNGSFKCICHKGFEGDAFMRKGCKDVNECKNLTLYDNRTTDCLNFRGKYQLSCKEGFIHKTEELDGFMCIDSASKTYIILIIFFLLLVGISLVLVILFIKRQKSKNKPLELSSKVGFQENNGESVYSKEGKPNEEVTYENIGTSVSPNRIKVEDLTEFIQKVMELDSSGFGKEFESIEKVAKHSTAYSKNPKLKIKNRFQNIFPYDQNRVVLSKLGDDRLSDYINASHITDVGSNYQIIAAQGPMENTVNDFWRMIVEQNVGVVVMVTQLVEGGKNKCIEYWPENGSVEYGNVTITKESFTDWETFTKKVFTVSCDNEQKTKQLVQWHYLCWPDHGIPTDVQSFLRFRNKVRKSMIGDDKMLVHCSAGVGRTGCFIAIDNLIEEAENEKSIDVVACVTRLRQKRPFMVQTIIQYDFIYIALKSFVNQADTCIELANFQSAYMNLCKTGSEGRSVLKKEFETLNETAQSYACTEELVLAKTTANSWNAVFVNGFQTEKQFLLACFPCEKDVERFWKICHDFKCTVVLIGESNAAIDHLLPTPNQPLVLGDFTVNFREKTSLDFGTLIDVFIAEKNAEDIIYENQASINTSDFIKTRISIVHACCDTKEHINKEFFDLLKSYLASLEETVNSSSEQTKFFVLNRSGSSLASYYVACNNFFSQMSLHQEVDIFRIVFGLKQSYKGNNLTFTQYSRLYELVAQEIGNKLFYVI